jgi:hypothetical protein
MVALAIATAALAVGHADGAPVAYPNGIAFGRRGYDIPNRIVTWDGRIGAFDPDRVTWSPSGRYVARWSVVHHGFKYTRSWVITRANGTDRNVLDDADSDVSWSRDESQLVYAQSGTLAVADGDGANVRPIATTIRDCSADCGANFDRPTLSPDGTTIALLITETPTGLDGPYRNVPAHLWTVPVAGGTATPLNSDDICPPDTDLEWSADSTSIAYVANPCDEIYGYDLDVTATDGRALLSTPLRGGYAFAPHGAMLAYTSRRGVVLETQGHTRRTIAGARSPSWQPGSPDRLAVAAGGWVEAVDAPNGPQRRLYRGTSPAWTTHGIAYAVPRCGPRQGIWLAGRRLTNLCEVDGPHGTPWRDEIWASDRKREHVTCGAGFDVAHVDPQDVVAPDCEVVKRP